MPKPSYKGYESDEIPPDDFSQDGSSEERVFEQDPWKDTGEAVVTPEQEIKAEVDGLLARRASEGVSEPVQAVPETMEEYKKPDPSKPKNVKGRTEAQRKSDWRKNNRAHYLEKNREYVRAYRDRKKASSATSIVQQ